MHRNLIIIVHLILLIQFSSAQITVDQDQLSNALKEDIEEEITSKLTSSVQSAEAWITKETYFSIILEPLEPFGINPSDPNFINQANDIYKKIQQKVENDPTLTRSGLLKDEMKGLVKQGIINYASSYIDKESFEIYDQCSNLIISGKEKIEALLDAAEGISGLAPDDEDYESNVTAILKNYGIKSDYFYLIDDLDKVLSVGYDKLADPISAFSTVASAMSSDDPVYKIEMLLELGESFGGKVPIIGDLITPIFTLGKGVLSAAKGLENVFEKNLNQGCISSAGTYASVNKNKRTLFIQQFPNAGRVCPLNQDIYNPVYNNTYLSTSYATDLYFYLNNKWVQGKKDNLHLGRDDIFSTIQWLRSNGYAEKATDLEFIVKSFQKEYGWKIYTNEVQKRIDRIQQLFQYSYSTINICEKQKVEQFYMDKIGFNWLIRLLNSADLEYTWNELKNFNIATQDILNSMIKNYYLSKHHNNLNQLDRIIRNLEENVPVNIYGTVNNGNGVPVGGAKLQVGLNSMFSSGDPDHKIITSTSGYFSYYILMMLDNNVNMTVSATTPDGNTVTTDIRVEPGLKVNAYRVELRLPYEERDTSTSVSQDSTTTITPPDTVTPPLTPDTTVIDINTLLSQSDCANVPGAVAEWDPVNKIVSCRCTQDFYTWDDAQKKCVPDIQAILNNSDCSQYLNTQPVWDYSSNEPICDCKPGYVWNEEGTGCVEREALQVANSDCSGYFNSRPVWDTDAEMVICDCLPGYVWNDEGTGCVPEWEEAIASADCSGYGNTEPVWDPVGKEVYCDCIPGYEWANDNLHCERITTEQPLTEGCSLYPNTEPVYDPSTNQYFCECLPGYTWNSSRTGCVPERKKPNIDWDGILTATMGILNAASGNNTYTGTSSTGSLVGTQTQQPVVHQSNCNDQQQAGANTPEVHNIDLGQSFGSFTFDYQTFTAKDQIIITNGGITIFNSGCVGEKKSVQLNLSGYSSTISVRVNPNCEGGSNTQWNFTVHCPR